jgi:hypothetical protein
MIYDLPAFQKDQKIVMLEAKVAGLENELRQVRLFFAI